MNIPERFGLVNKDGSFTTKYLEQFFSNLDEKSELPAIDSIGYVEPVGYALLYSLLGDSFASHHAVSNNCILYKISEHDILQITQHIRKLVQVDSMFQVLDHVVSELLQNIFHHSEMEYGYVAFNTFADIGRFQVAIVDRGIGIRKSLLKNPQFSHTLINDESALAIAIQAKMTSNPHGKQIHHWVNAGEGLFWAKQFLQENKGNFYIHSGNGQIFSKDNETILKTNGLWQGTCVVLDFDMHNILVARDVFDRYAPESSDFQFLNFS